MKKRDTKKRKAYKYSRKMRKTGHIGTRKLKGGQWWRRLFGAREAPVAPESTPQPAPQPPFWRRMFGRPRVAPAPQPPVAPPEPLVVPAPIPAENPLAVANAVVPEGLAPQESQPYEDLLSYLNMRNSMGNKRNTNKTIMNSETFTKKNIHMYYKTINFLNQVNIYLESIILEIRDYEILISTPEFRTKANDVFDIQSKLNLHLKRIIQISNTLTEFKDVIRKNFTSEGPFKNYLNRGYPSSKAIAMVKNSWSILIRAIDQRIDRLDYIKNYILFLLNHFIEGYTEDESFKKIPGIEQNIKYQSNLARKEGMVDYEHEPETWPVQPVYQTLQPR
jgi:hypothetical protein